MRKVIAILLTVVLFVYSVRPAYAFSSVSNCAQNPSCAATLVQQGVLQSTTAATGTATAVTVQQVIGYGLPAATITFAGVAAWRLAAQQAAEEAGESITTTTQCLDGGTPIFEVRRANGSISQIGTSTPWGTGYTVQNSRVMFSNGRQIYLKPGDSPIGWFCTNPVEELDLGKLAEWLDRTLPEIDFSPYTDVSPLPNPSPTPVIDQETGDLVDPQDIPSPDTDPDDQPLPDDDTDTEDETDTDGDGVPDDLETEIEPTTFDATHFMVHAQTVFSQKFPMDILGELPESGDLTCPQLVLFDHSYQLCIIIDFLSVLKYPAIVAVAIWALLSL